MLDVKLLAVDLDETFLDANTKLSARNREAVCKAVEQGILFVVASGRMRYRIPDDVLSIPGLRYLVSANGASVVDLATEEIIYEDPIPSDVALDIYRDLRKFPIYMEFYSKGYAYTDDERSLYYSPSLYSSGRREIMSRSIIKVEDLSVFISEPGHAIDKINIPVIPKENSAEIGKILDRPEISSTQSLPNNAEVNHHTANKGNGLRFLCGLLGIPPQKVLAFGDANNDLDMFRFAGHSVAMGNGRDEAKDCARYVTKTNSEDGVAWFLENYVLEK